MKMKHRKRQLELGLWSVENESDNSGHGGTK